MTRNPADRDTLDYGLHLEQQANEDAAINPGAYLTYCSICSNPADETGNPDIDPTCTGCQEMLAKGFTIAEIQRITDMLTKPLHEAPHEPPPFDGVYEARWDYDLGRWVYPDEQF